MEIYCLRVVIAYPDYKRPSVDVIVEHFPDESKARNRLKTLKEEYISDHWYEGDEGEEHVPSIEEFDAMVKSGDIADYIYNEWYMDIPPFDAKIFKVSV